MHQTHISPSPILITGVGKRIGFVLCQHLLAQGYTVIGTYRREHPELNELRKQGATLIACDFSLQAQVDQFIQHLQTHHPVLRGIIHNASDWSPDQLTDSDQVFQRMMQIHASAPYQINLACLEMLEDGSDIVHITDYIVEKGSKKHIAYAASKAALDNMTLSFASLLAPQVKVNSIAPALIQFNPGDDDLYRQKSVAKALIPKEGGCQEMTDALDYLLHSNYVTGRTLSVDGGRHLK